MTVMKHVASKVEVSKIKKVKEEKEKKVEYDINVIDVFIDILSINLTFELN